MTTKAAEPTETPKKKSGRGPVLMAAVAVVVLLGGGGAYWMFAKGSPKEGAADAKSEKEKEEEAGPGAAIAMEPFVVNLADMGGSHFLRVNMSLVVKDEEQAKEFEESSVTKAKVRSVILELLALQKADELITPVGKTELKKAIAEAATKAVSEIHITDVLFSEFVVQF